MHFVDHASKLRYVVQAHLTTHETLKAKENYELLQGLGNHAVISTDGDNIHFKEFTQRKFRQSLDRWRGLTITMLIAEADIQPSLASPEP
jgi:hypothetical protein